MSREILIQIILSKISRAAKRPKTCVAQSLSCDSYRQCCLPHCLRSLLVPLLLVFDVLTLWRGSPSSSSGSNLIVPSTLDPPPNTLINSVVVLIRTVYMDQRVCAA